MNWLKKNKRAVAALVAALIAVFAAVSRLTPSKTDDAVADRLMPLADTLEQWSTNSPGTTNAAPERVEP